MELAAQHSASFHHHGNQIDPRAAGPIRVYRHWWVNARTGSAHTRTDVHLTALTRVTPRLPTPTSHLLLPYPPPPMAAIFRRFLILPAGKRPASLHVPAFLRKNLVCACADPRRWVRSELPMRSTCSLIHEEPRTLITRHVAGVERQGPAGLKSRVELDKEAELL